MVKIVDADETIVYQYDEKNNPYKNIVGFSNYSLEEPESSKNNVTKAIITSNSSSEIITITYDYVYNSLGYPMKVIETTKSNANSQVDIDTETYTYNK